MFSMCSKLTPRARIPDTRIPQLMQPCYSPWIIAVVCERERSNAKLVIHPEHGEGGADGMAGLHGDHPGDLARLVDGHQIWVSKDLGNVEIKVSPLAVVASCRCLL